MARYHNSIDDINASLPDNCMASDVSDVYDQPLISKDTTEIIKAPYNPYNCIDPVEIITALDLDDDRDKYGNTYPALTADEISEESGDEGVQDRDKGEPEKGGQRVDHDETPDHVVEMDEFTEVWNNLGLRVDGGRIRGDLELGEDQG